MGWPRAPPRCCLEVDCYFCLSIFNPVESGESPEAPIGLDRSYHQAAVFHLLLSIHDLYDKFGQYVDLFSYMCLPVETHFYDTLDPRNQAFIETYPLQAASPPVSSLSS